MERVGGVELAAANERRKEMVVRPMVKKQLHKKRKVILSSDEVRVSIPAPISSETTISRIDRTFLSSVTVSSTFVLQESESESVSLSTSTTNGSSSACASEVRERRDETKTTSREEDAAVVTSSCSSELSPPVLPIEREEVRWPFTLIRKGF